MHRAAPVALAALLTAAPLGALAASEPAPSLGSLLDELRGAQGSPGASVAAALRAVARAEGIALGPAPPCMAFDAALAAHAARLRVALPAAHGLAEPQARALGCLLGALHAANLAHDATFAGADRGAMRRAWASEGSAELDALLEGRSHARLLGAAVHVAEAVDLALPLLAQARLLGAPPVDLWPVVRYDDAGDTVYDRHYVLIVDLDGDDVYDNNAGGVIGAVGQGIYEVDESGAFVAQDLVLGYRASFGGDVHDSDMTLAAGLVLDAAGNDTYGMKRPPAFMDAAKGCTTEPVVGIVGTIGGGIMGVGMAFDLAGDNTYVGRTQTQGAGHVLGVGVLYTGPGRDDLEGIRATQGSGLLGGLGVLIDEGGDSTYLARSPAGGVFNGDTLVCDDEARYAQGSMFDRRQGPGPDVAGILIDRGGDDTYGAEAFAQGFGQGPGFGLLLDRAGNDGYTATRKAQGAAQSRNFEGSPQAAPAGGLGLLVDEAGDDAYAVGWHGQGFSTGEGYAPPPDENLAGWAVLRNESLGLLWDRLGQDAYTRPGRGDGVTLTDGVLGVFRDEA